MPKFRIAVLWGIPAPLFVGIALLSLLLGGVIFDRFKPTPPIALADFTYTTPSGESLRLDALGGQPVLLNFWATWCPPCLEELPVLNTFAEDPRNSGVRIVGIAIDDPKAVAGFLKSSPLKYPVLIDTSKTGDQLGPLVGNREGVLPFSVLIDASGHILATRRAAFKPEELATFAKSALP